MKHAVFCLVLVAGLAFAQQQGQRPPTGAPPYGTPPTFPEGGQTPRAEMPPDTQAPPPRTMSTDEAEQQITQHLRSEPGLANTNVDAKTNATSVILTGTVDTEEQHDLAIRIAQSYAGERKIVDRINVGQQT